MKMEKSKRMSINPLLAKKKNPWHEKTLIIRPGSCSGTTRRTCLRNPMRRNFEERRNQKVECQGITFENDDARREYSLGILREKLKDLEFRKIKGFPIDEDEDILALSDPPCYMACPNPWLGDLVRIHGKLYDRDNPYSRKPSVFLWELSLLCLSKMPLRGAQ